MARTTPSLHVHMHNMHMFFSLPATINFLIILMAILSIFSIVTFLCGSHRVRESEKHKEERKKTIDQQLGEKRAVERLHSTISSKALKMAKMISWRKVQNEEEEEEAYDDDDDNQAVWKRTIIMGERCRPLNFSGNILYDSDGKLLPDSAH